MGVTAMVDTSAFIALVDRGDDRNAAAAAALKSSLDRRDLLLTTNYIVTEALSLAQNRLGMAAVRAIAEDHLDAMTVVWVTPEDHNCGFEALLSSGRRRLSLVDCVTFAVMRRLRVVRAFAYDRHFDEQGFERLE